MIDNMLIALLLPFFASSQASIVTAIDDLALSYEGQIIHDSNNGCFRCQLLPEAQWYFQNDTLALIPGQPEAIRPEWLSDVPAITSAVPILLASPDVVPDATMDTQQKRLQLDDNTNLSFDLVEQFPLNQSYWNTNTATYFDKRSVRIRGTEQADLFTAQTIWPHDYRIPQNGPLQPLQSSETLEKLVKSASLEAFSVRHLWQRNNGDLTTAENKTVLALMLNGAQGDDHEALAGHFAFVTGQLDQQGHLYHWLVNNFYSPDIYSEKDIVAAVTPMDNYLADLNRGQNYYRPSYMLVVTLNEPAPVMALQQSLEQMLQHFYRHDYLYAHAQMNCSGISLDTAKALGWQPPERGHNGYLKAIGAYFYLLATQRDFSAARQIYDYLTTEKIRLLPAQTFDALGNDLINLINHQTSRQLSAYESELQKAIDAMWFVSFPQLPSSRAQGTHPAYSVEEYLAMAPADHGDWQSVELMPRYLPADVARQTQPVNPPGQGIPWPVGLIMVGLLFIFIVITRRLMK